MFRFFLLCCVLCSASNALAEKAREPNDSKTTVLNHKMKALDGKEVDLNKYLGKVILIVNVASECGLTPQYEQLQELHDQYSTKGLAILGFPCNQFGSQEPGNNKEIQDFCTTNYGVKFDLFSKVEVNGKNACKLYKQLTSLSIKPKGAGDISWNFEKFVVNRKGKVIARFSPRTSPNAPELVKLIESSISDE